MIYRYNYLFVFLVFFYGCTTLNKTLIESANRNQLQPLVLIPEYDVYDVRIDIIRQTKEEEVNDSTTETKKVPYHNIGFYLGNGLFVDLNDNISLLVPKLFNINGNENFTIQQLYYNYLIKSYETYKKTDHTFSVYYNGFIKTNTEIEIENRDSVVLFSEGLFSKYKILKSDSSLTYQSGWNKISILKSEDGYFYNTLFGKEEYKQINNEIYINKRYIIRSKGDMIEIFSRGLFTDEILKYRIIKTGNLIYVYTPYYTGLEISKTGNEIEVWKNTTKICRYTLK